MELDQEIKTYKSKFSELIQQKGKYVVIIGTRIIGTYNDYEDALQEGYKTCKLKSFLVKKIELIESIQFI